MLELVPYQPGSQRSDKPITVEDYQNHYLRPLYCTIVASAFRRVRRRMEREATQQGAIVIDASVFKNKVELAFRIKTQSAQTSAPLVIILDEPLNYVNKADIESEVLNVTLDDLRNGDPSWTSVWFSLRDFESISEVQALKQLKIYLGRGITYCQELIDFCSLDSSRNVEEKTLMQVAPEYKDRLGLVRLSICRTLLAALGRFLHDDDPFAKVLVAFSILADAFEISQLHPAGQGWGGNVQGWEAGWHKSKYTDATLVYLFSHGHMGSDYADIMDSIFAPCSAISILMGTRVRGKPTYARCYSGLRNLEKTLRLSRNALEHPIGAEVGTYDIITSLLISSERLRDTLDAKSDAIVTMRFPYEWQKWDVLQRTTAMLSEVLAKNRKSRIDGLIASRSIGLPDLKQLVPVVNLSLQKQPSLFDGFACLNRDGADAVTPVLMQQMDVFGPGNGFSTKGFVSRIAEACRSILVCLGDSDID